MRHTDRFDGWIGGLGTSSGTRLVIGHWPRSPLGAFTDVMVERPDGHRVLYAPSEAVAEFVAAAYQFDEVHVGPVDLRSAAGDLILDAGQLRARISVGRRTLLGAILRTVPAALATSRWWIATIDRVARRVLPGVRTVGSAGNARVEYYGARDMHRITDAVVTMDGVDHGDLADVHPPVRFGFGSTPTTPCWVRITTLVTSTDA